MRLLFRALVLWAALTLLGVVVAFNLTRLPDGPMPDRLAQEWAMDYLQAARLGDPLPEPPPSAVAFTCRGPLITTYWLGGRALEQVISTAGYVAGVRHAAAEIAESAVARHSTWARPMRAPDRPRFTISLVLGEGPILLGVPFVSNLWLVPLRDGLVVRVGEDETWMTPETLRQERLYDQAVPLPIPDLSFGVDVEGLLDRMARDVGASFSELLDDGEVRRFRAGLIAETPYPRPVPVSEGSLRAAAIDGAEFLLMHQQPAGRFTYIYDGGRDGPHAEPYNLPRHAGTAYFLAQVARLHGMESARQGAIRALHWIRRAHLRTCGGRDRGCIAQGPRADVGAAALTAVAAAEILAAEDDAAVRGLLVGLMGFLRAQQREDGELMHEYDLSAQAPIDVQHMYYSGEAALAFFRAHRVLDDERDLEAGRRLMEHLTGAGWNFFGSRYFYGEEHWTCIAAGEAYDRVPLASGLDFCLRWAEWNEALQFGEEEAPWAVAGMYGVGPVIVPRLTPVGSRSEAFVSTYEMARLAGVDASRPRRLVQRGLAALLRWRWAPGPTHLLANPVRAMGGIPGSPVDLSVRNDFVQHGGSAIIRWAAILARESSPSEPSD